jgi:hypothetical protein
MLINRRASWTHSGARHRGVHQGKTGRYRFRYARKTAAGQDEPRFVAGALHGQGERYLSVYPERGDQGIESTKHSPTFNGRTTTMIRMFRDYVDDVLTLLVLRSQLAVANRALAMMPDDDRFDIFS